MFKKRTKNNELEATVRVLSSEIAKTQSIVSIAKADILFLKERVSRLEVECLELARELRAQRKLNGG